MPNTLAHLGVQTIASRAVLRDADLRWIFVGAVIPDVPWIANRALVFAFPDVDVFAVRPYWIAQASWFGSLWLCAALASLASRPRRVFLLLAANAFGHLLLDALQTKWGNGVHLWAPFDWFTWNLGWFWPESAATVALTGLGALVAAWALVETARRAPQPRRGWPGAGRLALAALFLALYVGLPLTLRQAVLRADAHSLQTLRSPEGRAGREVGFDRVWLEVPEDGEAQLHVLGGQAFRATGRLPTASGPVSARGRFVDAATLELDAVHRHGGFPREWASYLGLACVAAVVGLGAIRDARAGRAGAS